MLTKKYIPIKLHKYNHFCHPFLYVYITTFSLFCKLYTFTNVLNILYFSKVFGKIPESNIKNYSYYFIHYEEKQTKKEILPYPICSVVAVFKMLVRILNTLRSRIRDMVVFLFFCVLAPEGMDAIVFGKRRGRNQKTTACSEDDLIRILNTLRSRIWDMVVFLFSVFWLQKE